MRVLGLGDNVVDKYVNLKMMYPGGNALNFAVFAKKLKQDASFLGVFGSDEEAKHVLSVINELGIDNSHSRNEIGENGCARVEIVDCDRVFLGSNEGGVTREFPIILNRDDMEYLKEFELIHMGLYSHVNHLLPDLVELSAEISYDFSDDFTQADIDKAIEFVDYGFFSCSALSTHEAKAFLKQNFHPNNKILVVTRGSKSVIAYDGKEFYKANPAFIEPVDTMAAGDSFLTAFLVYLLDEGSSVEEAMMKAHQFAAESCLVEGSFGFGKSYEEK